MKILKVKFENLNSLTGQHTIDLSTGPLAAAGIFAITGPTGAGKSTILDAITLALFGRAARYGNTSNPENMMSRHTGRCSAEVEFEVPRGRFRATWSLNRSRGKSDGNVQPAKRYVYNSKDVPQAEKIADANALVEELVGLDAERFLRSALLAQNEFARFLKATPDERATLLESLTDTAIYTRLGRRAFEIHKQREDDLQSRRAILAHLEIMDDDQRADLQQQIAALEKKSTDLKSQVELLGKSVTSGEQAQQLTAAISGHEQTRQKLLVQLQQSEPNRKLLAQHKQALRFRDELLELDRKESQLVKDNAALASAQTAAHDSTVDLHAAIAAAAHMADSKAKLTDKKIKQANEEESRLESERKELNDWLTAHSADAALVDQLPAISTSVSELVSERKNLAGLKFEISELDAQIKTEKATLETSSELFAKAGQGLRDCRAAENETNNQFQALGGNDALDSIDEKIETARTLQSRLADLSILIKRRDGQVTVHQTTIGQQIALAETLVAAQSKQTVAAERVAKQKELVESRIATLQQATLALSLQDHRKNLVEGEPCPLCGSTDHPLADHDPDQQESVVVQYKKDLAVAQSELKKLESEWTSDSSELERLKVSSAAIGATIDSQKQEIESTEKQIAELALLTGIQTPTLSATESARETQTETFRQVSLNKKQLQEVFAKKEQAEKSALLASVEHGKLREKIDGLTRTLEQNDQRRLKLEGQLQKTEAATAAARDRLLEQLKAFGVFEIPGERQGVSPPCPSEQLQAFGVVEIPSDDENQIVAELQSRSASFRKQSEAIATSTKSLETIRQQLVTDLDRQKQLAVRQSAFRERLGDQMFSGFAPDPSRLKQLVTVSESLEQAEQRIVQADSDRKSRLAMVQDRELTAKNSRESRDLANVQLTGTLAATDFENMAGLRVALLQPTRADEIELEIGQIDRKLAENETVSNQDRSRLEVLVAAGAPLGEKLDAERAKHELLKAEAEQLRDNLSISGQKLKQDDLNREKRAEGDQQLRAEREQLKSWEQMKHLIGSADGKKFRVFAQGLSLDILTRYANRHLEKLNDRYRLQRVNDDKLDLEICDRHQANTTRPMASLSGGESFLASLALALGLSDLAGRNVRIDSLFIDEGFGALDAETLDVAVAALEGLQSSNKTIGVISHVDLLKERITTQIQVTPISGGRSELRIVS